MGTWSYFLLCSSLIPTEKKNIFKRQIHIVRREPCVDKLPPFADLTAVKYDADGWTVVSVTLTWVEFGLV